MKVLVTWLGRNESAFTSLPMLLLKTRVVKAMKIQLELDQPQRRTLVPMKRSKIQPSSNAKELLMMKKMSSEWKKERKLHICDDQPIKLENDQRCKQKSFLFACDELNLEGVNDYFC